MLDFLPFLLLHHPGQPAVLVLLGSVRIVDAAPMQFFWIAPAELLKAGCGCFVQSDVDDQLHTRHSCLRLGFVSLPHATVPINGLCCFIGSWWSTGWPLGIFFSLSRPVFSGYLFLESFARRLAPLLAFHSAPRDPCPGLFLLTRLSNPLLPCRSFSAIGQLLLVVACQASRSSRALRAQPCSSLSSRRRHSFPVPIE
jgi:hypothetical protein